MEVRWSVAPFLAVKTRFFCDLPKCEQFYAAPEVPSHGQIHRNKGSWQALPDFDQKIILSMLEANRWSPQTNGERPNNLFSKRGNVLWPPTGYPIILKYLSYL